MWLDEVDELSRQLVVGVKRTLALSVFVVAIHCRKKRHRGSLKIMAWDRNAPALTQSTAGAISQFKPLVNRFYISFVFYLRSCISVKQMLSLL